MEKTIDNTCSSDVIKLLFTVVLIAFIIWLLYSLFTHCNPSEDFISTLKSNNKVLSNNPSVYEQKEILIKPTSCDVDTGTIQSGSKFIHQDHYFTPWGTVVASDGSSTNDSLSSDYTMSLNQCDSSCCSDQWPVPFKINNDLHCNSES